MSSEFSEFKNVEIKILNHTFKYKVNEPEDLVNSILKEIKSKVEDISQKTGDDNLEYFLLYFLLNEKLENEKLKNNLKALIKDMDELSSKNGIGKEL
ncbi:MAG: cell division protein ZapA [Thermotogae bacterium]|nr:cell division protein ZapA [Thermotogota bacterium]HOO75698.1 cell division protein ZapA [Tepiditoga sp.]